MLLPIALLLAILPGMLIAWFIYAKDKHEPEPHARLAICFFLGMLSTIPAIFLEIFGSAFASPSPDIVVTFIYAVIIVAGSEELVKFLFLKFYIYNHKDFSEPLDGIVYAMMIGLGFATLENILYVLSGGIEVAILRMFTAVPGHAAFAVLMGYFAGIARFKSNPNQRIKLLATGFGLAVTSHGLYDFFLFQRNYAALALFALVTLIVSIVFSVILINKHSRESRQRKAEKDNMPPLQTDIFDDFNNNH